jgi:hypothetical protein
VNILGGHLFAAITLAAMIRTKMAGIRITVRFSTLLPMKS